MNATINPALMRRLRFVPRWAVVPHVHRQNVAEHSFHVAWIVAWLIEELDNRDAVTVHDLMLALVHDSNESVTGDTPSPSGVSKDPSNYSATYAVMKVADYLESALFLNEERYSGNVALDAVRQDVYERGQRWASVLGADFTAIAAKLAALTCPTKHPAMMVHP